MSYCDGCHHDDPFECGASLADHARTEAEFLRSDAVCQTTLAEYGARQREALAAALERCGCPCACHGGVVDGPATATTGGAS